MNFELAEEVQKQLNLRNIEGAISHAETRLLQLQETPFNTIVGKKVGTDVNQAIEFVTTFYNSAKAAFLKPSGGGAVRQINPETFEEEIIVLPTNTASRKVKAIYIEMNGFTINHDSWYVDAFAYSQAGELDNLNWLADYEFETDVSLPIVGYEQLQMVYAEYMNNEQWKQENLRAAAEICELLVLLRLQQFFERVYTTGQKENMEWGKLPLLVTAHEYDIICSFS